MSLLSTCRSTAPAPARMMTSAVPFLILFLAGVSFAERYWVNFGARRRVGLGLAIANNCGRIGNRSRSAFGTLQSRATNHLVV